MTGSGWLFVLRRAGSGLVVVLGVSVLIFLLARVMPGDPARLALGPAATPDQVAALRHVMGLDQPLWRQYAVFLGGAAHLDFGMSLYTGQRVASDLATDFPATAELVIVAGLVMGIFGVAIGVVSAHYQDRWPDNAARLLSLLAVAMPNFVWAVMLMLVLSFWLDLLPIAGRLSESMLPPPTVTGLFTVDAALAGQWDVFADAVRHLLLPAVTLALPGLAQIARLTRTNLADSYARPFVEFARAYGLSERSIAGRWALRPAITPAVTVLGMQVVALFGSAFLIETVFNWPGMARYGVQAILHKDLNAIVSVVLVISVLFVVFNMLVDGVVTLIDPRIRLRGKA